MKVVWVVNQSGHDVSSADKFGVLRPLTRGSVNPFSVDRLVFDLRFTLDNQADFDDFVLLAGTPLLNALVVSYFLLRFGVVNMLIFDAKTRAYVPRTLTRELVYGSPSEKVRDPEAPAERA